MPECYVSMRGYQLKCDKLLHRGWGSQNDNFSVLYFLNDPYLLEVKFFGKLCQTVKNLHKIQNVLKQ